MLCDLDLTTGDILADPSDIMLVFQGSLQADSARLQPLGCGCEDHIGSGFIAGIIYDDNS
jgi:hypothetical protein